MTSTRRTFFASVVALAIPDPLAEERRIAEEKRIEDRWKRIEKNLDRLEANRKAWANDENKLRRLLPGA